MSDDMETLSGVVGVLVALQLLCRVLVARAHFMYDESPAAGYVVEAGHDDSYFKKMLAHKTYYVSNTNQKNMKLVNERAVDSYFRVLRATPQSYTKDISSPPEQRGAVKTEPPMLHQKYTVENNAYAPRNDRKQDDYRGNKQSAIGLNQITGVKDEELRKPNRKDYFRKHSVYEKHTVVSKVNKRNNRRPHRAQNFQQKLYLSQVRDNILRSADGRPVRVLADSALSQERDNILHKSDGRPVRVIAESVLSQVRDHIPLKSDVRPVRVPTDSALSQVRDHIPLKPDVRPVRVLADSALSQVRDNILHKPDVQPVRFRADSAQTAVDKDSHNAKEYTKRNTMNRELSSQTMGEPNDNQLNSLSYMRVTGNTYEGFGRRNVLARIGHRVADVESEGKAPYALFYRMNYDPEGPPLDGRAALEETADGAYYRGSASSHVDLNIGRKATPVGL